MERTTSGPGVTFASIYRRKKSMLTLGQAALEDAWEYMAPRECALFILDETACILSRNGDPQTLQQLSALGFNDGTYCAEGIIGTCALSLAAISGQAVKTMADQHFKQALWNWAFCATPLFDCKGRLTGTIALACPVEQTTAADLPLTLAIAREVGNLLLTDKEVTLRVIRFEVECVLFVILCTDSHAVIPAITFETVLLPGVVQQIFCIP